MTDPTPSRYIGDFAWGADVEQILKMYTEDEAAIYAVISVLNMFVHTEHALRGVPNVQGAISHMTDITINLHLNPFWQRHGTAIMADVSGRWRDWMRHLEAAKVDANAEPITKFQTAALRSSFISLADYALLHRTDGLDREYLPQSAELHLEILKVLEPV